MLDFNQMFKDANTDIKSAFNKLSKEGRKSLDGIKTAFDELDKGLNSQDFVMRNLRISYIPVVVGLLPKKKNGKVDASLKKIKLMDTLNIGKSQYSDYLKLYAISMDCAEIVTCSNVRDDVKNYVKVKDSKGKNIFNGDFQKYQLDSGVTFEIIDGKTVYTLPKSEAKSEPKSEAKDEVKTDSQVSLDLELEKVDESSTDVIKEQTILVNKLKTEIAKKVEILNKEIAKLEKMNLAQITE